jgi:uncharacterized protein
MQILCNFFNLQDILVVGVGDAGNKIDQKIIQYMKQRKINLEILPTERAWKMIICNTSS